jgi:cell wall-associated NlpC family hydrolase
MTSPTDAPKARTRRHTARRSALLSSRALVLAVGVSAGAAALPAAFAASGTALAEVPGDHHSPRVAGYAAVALEVLHEYEATDSPIAGMQYRAALQATAAATADEMGTSAVAMARAWSSVDVEHQTAVLAALSQLGVAYHSDSSQPGVGFDCSGLTTFAWAEAGVSLPRQSGEQIAAAARRDEDSAEAGDLAQYPGHVMLYLGVEGAVVHASNPENDVELWMLSSGRAAGVRYGDPAG